MPQPTTPADAPLDLSSIDAGPAAGFDAGQKHLPAATHPAREPADAAAVPPALPGQPRLVDIGGMAPADLREAEAQAELVNFRDSASMLGHGEAALREMGTVTRDLLGQATLGRTGEVGELAASVLDGVNILRIEDLMSESGARMQGRGGAPHRPGLLTRIMGTLHEAKTAAAGFHENRKRFDAAMDAAEARAASGKAELLRLVSRFDECDVAIRRGIQDIKISIAAAQVALDRGYGEEEALRQRALACTDRMEAMALSADVMAYRDALANFRGKTASMREALLQAATLIPIVASNRRAATTRVMKIDNGILFVLPNLRMAAAQAVGQYAIGGIAAEGERLDEANRRIMQLTSRNAHEVAVSAARSLGVDPRNVATLKQVAEQSIATLNEVIGIDEETAAADARREAELVEIRDTLVKGLQSVQRQVLHPPAAR